MNCVRQQKPTAAEVFRSIVVHGKTPDNPLSQIGSKVGKWAEDHLKATDDAKRLPIKISRSVGG